MKNVSFRTWTVPLALLGLSVFSYALLAPWLGFYWDDWPSIWYLHFLGPAGFRDVFAIDRPLLGWLFMLTTSIIGESTLAWQLFGVLTRWLTSLAFLGLLRQVWPQSPRQTTWTALLFAVYPGFTQQFISVTYGNAWLILVAFLVSLSTMAAAYRPATGLLPGRRWLLLAISWATAALTLFLSEYFFGLEFLRPALVWLCLSPAAAGVAANPWRRLRQAAVAWLPYLAIISVFLYWRLVVHETPRGHVQVFGLLAASPLGTALDIGKTMLADIVQSSLLAWAQVFNFLRMASFGRGPLALYLAVVAVALPLALLYLAKLKPGEVGRAEPGPEPAGANASTGAAAPRPALAPAARFAPQAILLGLLALLLGGIPFWITYLPIELRFPWDRFTMAMMPGASLLLAGLLAALPARPLVKAALLGVALSLAVGFHVQQANLYRREWNTQKAFFWQLAWRAPGIQPGTVLITAELPFTAFSDNSLTAPLNWIYAPGLASREMPYLLYAVESRLELGLPRLEPGIPITADYRATSFKGSTSQAIAIFSEPPGCVKVVDPLVDARLPQKPNYIDELLTFSNPDLIQAQAEPPARPPEAIFGPEPAHGWCYFFEKADLARQIGDWPAVVALGEQAFQRDERLYEVNAPELVPFIEGYAHTGQWDQARALSQQALDLSFRMKRMLCSAWSRIESTAAPDAQGQAQIEQARAELKCNAP